jgi:single-stranded-DNA-specific exonuclease
MDDADVALELLLTRERSRADELAAILEERNAARRAATESALDEAREAVEGREGDPFLMVASASAPVGVLGLVAGKLTERHYRPSAAVRLEEGEARASLRSIPEVDIVAALESAAELFVRFGGHARAAGFTARAEDLPQIEARVSAAIADQLQGVELRPEARIDAVVAPSEVNWGTLSALEELEPLGEGNPRPVLLVEGARVSGARRVGEQHARFHVEAGPGAGLINAIAFGQADRLEEVGDRLDVVGTLRVDTFRGEERLELRVMDFRRGAAVTRG